MTLEAKIEERRKQIKAEEAARIKAEQEALGQSQQQFDDRIKFLTELAVSIGIKKADLTAATLDNSTIPYVSAIIQGIAVGLEHHTDTVKVVIGEVPTIVRIEVLGGEPSLKDRILGVLIHRLAEVQHAASKGEDRIEYTHGEEVSRSTSKSS